MAFNSSETKYTKTITNAKGEKIALIDLVDNTVLVPDAGREAVKEVIKQYGAKRFVFAGEVKDAKPFPRDISMKTSCDLLASDFKFHIGIEAIEQAFPNKYEFYTQTLPAVFSGAEFTPAKMEEYQKGAADQYCRFHGEEIVPLLMVDNQNKIVGTIRLAVIENVAYLSDEMIPEVDKASPEFEARLKILLNKACHYLNRRDIDQALIRAAAGRETTYKDIANFVTGGIIADPNISVIHGPPTAELNQLKSNALEEAAKAIAALQPQNASLPWQQKNNNSNIENQPS